MKGAGIASYPAIVTGISFPLAAARAASSRTLVDRAAASDQTTSTARASSSMLDSAPS
jgi:hypothetical protein